MFKHRHSSAQVWWLLLAARAATTAVATTQSRSKAGVAVADVMTGVVYIAPAPKVGRRQAALDLLRSAWPSSWPQTHVPPRLRAKARQLAKQARLSLVQANQTISVGVQDFQAMPAMSKVTVIAAPLELVALWLLRGLAQKQQHQPQIAELQPLPPLMFHVEGSYEDTLRPGSIRPSLLERSGLLSQMVDLKQHVGQRVQVIRADPWQLWNLWPGVVSMITVILIGTCCCRRKHGGGWLEQDSPRDHVRREVLVLQPRTQVFRMTELPDCPKPTNPLDWQRSINNGGGGGTGDLDGNLSPGSRSFVGKVCQELSRLDGMQVPNVM